MDSQNKVETTMNTHISRKNLNTNRPMYIYNFNGKLVGKFRGPTEVAKKLLGVKGKETVENAHKIASLRSELSVCARNNSESSNKILFAQGYVPSYCELKEKEIVNNRKVKETRGNRVLQYDFHGNLMNVFENANDASEKLGKSTTWISILCNANFILRYDK